jgi:hypothetical protein
MKRHFLKKQQQTVKGTCFLGRLSKKKVIAGDSFSNIWL